MKKIMQLSFLVWSLGAIESQASVQVELNFEPLSSLHQIALLPSSFKTLSVERDSHQTEHVRLRQMYLGYPVWGADLVEHFPKNDTGEGATVNGIFYDHLKEDLSDVPPYVFNEEQKIKAEREAFHLYQKENQQAKLLHSHAKLIVYVDEEYHAHWAFVVHLSLKDKKEKMNKKVYILDALSFATYAEWSELKTLMPVMGGGLGGNVKVGKHIYDGLGQDYPALMIEREGNECYLANQDVIVRDVRLQDDIVHFACKKSSEAHANLYWDQDLGAFNGAYSPANDALYAGKIVKDMYQSWFGIPVLKNRDKAMPLEMRVHAYEENAYWDNELQQMTFGDGGDFFYPLVSLDVAAHEISHGFTYQHANLAPFGMPAAINEAFSDMASQAAQVYSTGKNDWMIGADVVKNGGALRYMDKPSKDCEGVAHKAMNCSVETIKAYKRGMDEHFGAGIFNRAFYLLATSEGWDVKKAFEVMVAANRFYWTPNVTFHAAACGVKKAADSLNYSSQAVISAMKEVGISLVHC